MFFLRRLNHRGPPPSDDVLRQTSSRASTTPTHASVAELRCHVCGGLITAATEHIQISPNRNIGSERRYHTNCFQCYYCKLPIDPKTQKLCFSCDRKQGDSNNQSEQHPFHKKCRDRFFGWVCVVCEETLPSVAINNSGRVSTKFEYLKHPFFDKERMCPHHAKKRWPQDGEIQQFRNEDDNVAVTTSEEAKIGEIRRCAGCHRFEPNFASSKHFIDVGDADTGRCVCLACCRTLVTTSDEAIPLWEKVMNFFEGPLGLITAEDSINGVSRQTLENIPVILVGMEALNDNMQKHSKVHYNSSQIMTRGLCLSEYSKHNLESFEVVSILCLSNLPAELTASILAHECTHAFIRLHPNFRYGEPLPLMVEEGLCQLIAFLFLNDGLEHSELDNSREDDSPSDALLRKYFKFCIETDQSIYGQGFRLAARAYAQMGMQELLYYISLNRDFPPI